MALSASPLLGASAQSSSLFLNATPQLGQASSFLAFMRQRARNKPARAPNPAEQMGSPANSAMFGGNLISPAMRALLGATS